MNDIKKIDYSKTPNIVVDNVFTENEIENIYSAINNPSGTAFISFHSQENTFINLPDNIIQKVTDYAKQISGSNSLILSEYCHAKYQNKMSKDGKYCYRPSLFPHYDETFIEPRFTFDYQLNANIDWPIIAEPNIKLILKNNQAATFSGTHQIHWRDPIEFKDNDFVEMIFFHFSDIALSSKTDEENKYIMSKAQKYKSEFLASGGFTNDYRE